VEIYKPKIQIIVWSLLQCGHGSKTVEMPRNPLRGCRTVRLQCGHGSKTVEMLVSSGLGLAVQAGLQCGHGSKTVEML